jgi:bifunctional ADP-heptose synthase (sugar kinase/adenylyltransferase)
MDELAAMRPQWRTEGKTLVWTNGIFDLLHAGPIRSLRDASARRFKGPGRPLMCQLDRAELLSALEMVDYVVIFDEPEPSAPLARLQPEIHCKGEEYAKGNRPVPERVVVESYGGRIRFLPLRQGRSTTGLMEKICAAAETKTS